MRALADAGRIRELLRALGREARAQTTLYLVGGACAVLRGWRQTTVDVDIELTAESDDLLRALPELKRKLGLNVELAAPHHFVPELPGWRERSPFVASFGSLAVFEYDFYGQALAKLERQHAQDLVDLEAMVRDGLVEPTRLATLFDDVEAELFRYPAVDPATLRKAVEDFAAGFARRLC